MWNKSREWGASELPPPLQPPFGLPSSSLPRRFPSKSKLLTEPNWSYICHLEQYMDHAYTGHRRFARVTVCVCVCVCARACTITNVANSGVTNLFLLEFCSNCTSSCDPTVEHLTASYDLLFRRLSIIKSSRATSLVKWLNGEKTNVSRIISVLVLRVLNWSALLACHSVYETPQRSPQVMFVSTAPRLNCSTVRAHVYCTHIASDWSHLSHATQNKRPVNRQNRP
jgi:hypothetical protein